MDNLQELIIMADNYGVIGFWIARVSHGYMSQWAHSKFIHDGNTFYSAEQFMMWGKANLFGDVKIAKEILRTKSPREQKELGRKVRGFKNKIWNKNRESIVIQGNLLKFSQNPDILSKLINTGEKVLVEASPSDTIWGVGLRPDNPDINNPNMWKGANLLGKCLMKVRHMLK